MMRFIDISNNGVVLRFLDNLIVTSGYKFGLEFFGIEGNEKIYKGKKGWGCISTNNHVEGRVTTSVSQSQIANRDLRVKKNFDLQKFITAVINIEKQRVTNGGYPII